MTFTEVAIQNLLTDKTPCTTKALRRLMKTAYTPYSGFPALNTDNSGYRPPAPPKPTYDRAKHPRLAQLEDKIKFVDPNSEFIQDHMKSRLGELGLQTAATFSPSAANIYNYYTKPKAERLSNKSKVIASGHPLLRAGAAVVGAGARAYSNNNDVVTHEAVRQRLQSESVAKDLNTVANQVGVSGGLRLARQPENVRAVSDFIDNPSVEQIEQNSALQQYLNSIRKQTSQQAVSWLQDPLNKDIAKGIHKGFIDKGPRTYSNGRVNYENDMSYRYMDAIRRNSKNINFTNPELDTVSGQIASPALASLQATGFPGIVANGVYTAANAGRSLNAGRSIENNIHRLASGKPWIPQQPGFWSFLTNPDAHNRADAIAAIPIEDGQYQYWKENADNQQENSLWNKTKQKANTFLTNFGKANAGTMPMH